MNKILLLGGSGKLGKYLVKELNITPDTEYLAPTHKECDITNYKQLKNVIHEYQPNIIIHAAGFVDTQGCENDKQKCLDINVGGTYNIVKVCRKYHIKLVYISSEYVFEGLDIPYTPQSPLNPINTYGISKACGELMVKTLDNHLIIRAPFIRSPQFPHEYAFTDHFTNKQYVNEISSDILNLILNKSMGIIHIIGEYQSIYDLAKKTKDDVKPIQKNGDTKSIIPTYLNLTPNI